MLYHFIMSTDNQSNAAQLNFIITFIHSTLTEQSPRITFSLLGIWQNDLWYYICQNPWNAIPRNIPWSENVIPLNIIPKSLLSRDSMQNLIIIIIRNWIPLLMPAVTFLHLKRNQSSSWSKVILLWVRQGPLALKTNFFHHLK